MSDNAACAFEDMLREFWAIPTHGGYQQALELAAKYDRLGLLNGPVKMEGESHELQSDYMTFCYAKDTGND